MGFTRYFNGNVTITPELLEDVKTIITESGVKINGWDGTGQPKLIADRISFNGSDEDEEGCETFTIINGEQSDFCKTNRNPYDLVVATVLRRVQALNNDFEADSDGGNEEEEANALY